MFTFKKIAALAAVFVLAALAVSAREYPLPPEWEEIERIGLKKHTLPIESYERWQKSTVSERLAFTVNGTIMSRLGLNNPLLIVPGSESNGASAVTYLVLGLDGKPAILKLTGIRIEVLFSENELPAGRLLISSQREVYFAYIRGVLFVGGFDASRQIGSRQTLNLYSKNATDQGPQVLLASEQTKIRAWDPKQGGAEVDFTYLQGVNFFFSGNTVSGYGLLNPPQLPGGPTPIPQALVIRREANNSWVGKFNNQADQTKTNFASIVDMCPTDSGTLYIAGRLTDAPNTVPNNQHVVTRIIDREPKQLGPYLRLAAGGIDCGSGGVQVYTATVIEGQPTVYGFSYIADSTPVENASPESPTNRFFSGSSADATLFTPASNFYVEPRVTYVISSGREIIKISQGKASVVKTQQQAPAGQPLSISLIDGRPILTQNEGVAVAYWLFQPSCQAPGTVQPGENLATRCPELAIENQNPSMTLTIGGTQLICPVSADGSTAVFNCPIPPNAPAGTYNARVTGQGLTFDVPVQVRGAGSIPAPRLSAITTHSGIPGPFAPRSRFYIRLAQATGRAEECPQLSACFELGGLSATLDGDPIRLMNNDGKGNLLALIPKSAQFKNRGDLTVSFVDSGTKVASAPMTVTLAPIANYFSTLLDPALGLDVPFMLDDSGVLVGWSLRPVKKGTSVTVFGTGCGLPTDIGDDQNFTEAIELPGSTSISAGQAGSEAKTRVEAPHPGVCSHKLTISPDATSGRTSIYFSSNLDSAATVFVE